MKGRGGGGGEWPIRLGTNRWKSCFSWKEKHSDDRGYCIGSQHFLLVLQYRLCFWSTGKLNKDEWVTDLNLWMRSTDSWFKTRSSLDLWFWFSFVHLPIVLWWAWVRARLGNANFGMFSIGCRVDRSTSSSDQMATLKIWPVFEFCVVVVQASRNRLSSANVLLNVQNVKTTKTVLHTGGAPKKKFSRCRPDRRLPATLVPTKIETWGSGMGGMGSALRRDMPVEELEMGNQHQHQPYGYPPKSGGENHCRGIWQRTSQALRLTFPCLLFSLSQIVTSVVSSGWVGNGLICHSQRRTSLATTRTWTFWLAELGRWESCACEAVSIMVDNFLLCAIVLLVCIGLWLCRLLVVRLLLVTVDTRACCRYACHRTTVTVVSWTTVPIQY